MPPMRSPTTTTKGGAGAPYQSSAQSSPPTSLPWPPWCLPSCAPKNEGKRGKTHPTNVDLRERCRKLRIGREGEEAGIEAHQAVPSTVRTGEPSEPTLRPMAVE